MKEKSKSGQLVSVSLLSAITASLCCITPVVALVAGASGVVSSFSWLEPLRPYLLSLTVLVLGFAWYQKLKPRTANEISCECEDDKKQPFMQTKKFLGIITAFAILIMTFPYYANSFYPKEVKKEIVVIKSTNLRKVEFKIKGMSCEACASHISNEVGKLEGIATSSIKYEKGTAIVEFDKTKINENEIKTTINSTGYKITKKKRELNGN